MRKKPVFKEKKDSSTPIRFICNKRGLKYSELAEELGTTLSYISAQSWKKKIEQRMLRMIISRMIHDIENGIEYDWKEDHFDKYRDDNESPNIQQLVMEFKDGNL